ncbi:Autolytic lysozyme [compost metagenome]
MQAKSSTNLFGIDVSHHQGTIKWPNVKAKNVKYAFIKASEGRTLQDTQFRRNATGAKAVGIPVGFYHYAHPQNNSPSAEAENFLETIKGLPHDLPCVLDMEEPKARGLGKSAITAWSKKWCELVEKATGMRPIIYSGASFAKDLLGSDLAKYPLWVAHYGVSQPMANPTWSKWSIFQYSDKDPSNLSGIGSGNVDLNWMEASFMAELTNKDEPVGKDYTGHWAEASIEAVIRAGLIGGYPDGSFKPDQPVTRAEMAIIVNRLLNK